MIDRRKFVAASAALLTTRPSFGFDGTPVKLRELYNDDGSFSEIITQNQGNRILVQGFMAPPLKADADFFVLTKMPMSVCPFCESAAEWPADILAVYTKRTVLPTPFNMRIEVEGIVETGERLDPATGFVSLLRLVDSVYS